MQHYQRTPDDVMRALVAVVRHHEDFEDKNIYINATGRYIRLSAVLVVRRKFSGFGIDEIGAAAKTYLDHRGRPYFEVYDYNDEPWIRCMYKGERKNR